MGALAAKAPVLVLAHGFSDHLGRYRAVFERLKKKFFKAYVYDARGHGRSQGVRGHVDRFDDFVDDFECVVAMAAKEAGSRPLFVLGHSMGGLVVLRWLLRAGLAVENRFNVRGAAVASPYLKLKTSPPAFKLAAAKLMLRIHPSLQFSAEINPSFLSHQASVIAAYVNDRLVHGKITPKAFFEIQRAAEETREACGPVGCPLLFLVPGEDSLVDAAATKFFFERLKHRNKDCVEFPGMHHELFNEVAAKEVDAVFAEWVRKTLGGA